MPIVWVMVNHDTDGYLARTTRAVIAMAVTLAAVVVGVFVAYATAYTASSGCEDYGVACHDAHPAQAVLIGGLGSIAVSGLIAVAWATLLHGSPFARSWPWKVVFAAGTIWCVLVWSGFPFALEKWD